MAKKSAHGYEIGKIESLTSTTAYMSDGQILRNVGDGWKLWRHVKPGYDIRDIYAENLAKAKAKASARPHYEAYKRELHSLAGLAKRGRLHMAVELMPDDPDGVWSEVCDGYGDNVHASIEEIAHLCKLYKLAMAE